MSEKDITIEYEAIEFPNDTNQFWEDSTQPFLSSIPKQSYTIVRIYLNLVYNDKPEQLYIDFNEIPAELSCEELVSNCIEYFNTQLKEKQFGIQLKSVPSFYSLLIAKKSGQAKIDYPPIEQEQNISELNFDKFALVYKESAINEILHFETSAGKYNREKSVKEGTIENESANKCCCRLIQYSKQIYSKELQQLIDNKDSFLPQARASYLYIRSNIVDKASLISEKSIMEKKQITFVTGNPKKLEEFLAIMGEGMKGYEILRKDLDLMEIQGEPEEIAIKKVELAVELVDTPVLIEDVSLCFDALQGLPGPYIKSFLKKLGCKGLFQLLEGFEDKTAYAQCMFAYSEGKGHPVIIFTGRTKGKIVVPRGDKNFGVFGWDPVFEPEGYDLTYAELEKEEKNKISHRYRAIEKVKEYFASLE